MFKRDIILFLAFVTGLVVVYRMENQMELLLPVLTGVAIVFITVIIRRIKSNHSGTPVQDKGAEDQARKVMLGSLFWSYLILGLALLVWRFLGQEMIQSLYVILYIGIVLLITVVLVAIARKNN